MSVDLGSLRALLSALSSANRAVVGALVLIAAVVAWILGLFSGIAAIATLAFAYLIELLRAQRTRESLREDALAWRGVVTEAEPIEDFFIKDWYGRGPEVALPPYVPRTAMERLNDGWDDERFVILDGKRIAGKSRLIYEAAKLRHGHATLVSKMPPGLGKPDPLTDLMNDRRGFASWEERQILVIRGLGGRLASGALSGTFMREWLDRHPKVLVIATLSPKDREIIERRGEERIIELERVEEQARVVELSDQLQGQELVDARLCFPDLDDEQLKWLPGYLASASSLRERFLGGEGRSQVGRAIVRAVADWQRTVGGRPAPMLYLRRIVPVYLIDAKASKPEDFEAAFDAGLTWALSPVRGAAALIYDRGEDGFEADAAVVNPSDKDVRWELRPSVWREIRDEIVTSLKEGLPEQVAAELLSAAETAQDAGWEDLGREALELAAELDENGTQYKRIAQVYTFGSPAGRDLTELVDSRRGEGFKKRYRESQLQATARRQRLARTEAKDGGALSRLIAEIYSHSPLRTSLRIFILVLIDVFSSLAGLFLALGLRALLRQDIDFGHLGGASRSGLMAWCALTIFVFALLRLYKQDAPRARLGEIIAAMGILGAIGFVGGLALDFSFPTAILMLLVALLATIAAAFIDYRLRVRYDGKSVGLVKKWKLRARTLLIGTSKQVAAVEEILHDGISRPTEIVGYLTTDRWEARREECLGTVRELGAVALRHDVSRVLIVDPRMPVRSRQDLAGLCHLRSLRVEAIPSIAEVRAGGSRLISGQSLVLHTMSPLWHGNAAFAVKRIGDFIAAAVALAFLSIFWGLIALAILIVDGLPVLVRSWRPGAGRKIFGMYRFRTTVEDSQSPIDVADRGGDESGTTTLGQFLRSHGLDELPQLLNVLVGDMSLVGPRPLHLSDHDKLGEEDLLRYLVLPGITGPWQVCGRSSVSTQELTKIDVAYLRHWTVFSDLEILVKSARLVLKGRKDLPAIDDNAAPEYSA
jgi:lipopolysaccharide/colanic/teichoic acid biosynthesis glycosyltransferase